MGTGSELLNSNTLKKLRPTTGSKISVGVDTDSNIEIGCDLTDYYTETQVDDLLTTRNNTFYITTDHTKLYMKSLGHYIRDSSDNSTVIHIDDDDITSYNKLSSNSDITTSAQLIATGQRTWNPSSKGVYIGMSGSGNDAAIDLCSAIQNSWCYIDFTHAGNDYYGRINYLSANDKFQIQTNQTTALEINTTACYSNGWQSLSDLKLKDDIEDVEKECLQMLRCVKPKTYK